MGMLSRFDINSDFTQFFLGAFILFLILTVALTMVKPKGNKQMRRSKVDDRYADPNNELID